MTMTRRAYSALTVKTVDEDRRIIRGVATTPAVDRVGDIVEPLGVSFKNPLPLLWQHQHDKPVGTVKFDKPTKDGITFEAELPVIKEEGTLRDRIEEAWQSLKAGLVRATSIGFRAIEYAFMDEGGIRFIKSEVYELSLVTIPAQPEAVITSLKNMDAAGVALVKQFDIGAPAASGNAGADEHSGLMAANPGASGAKQVGKGAHAPTTPSATTKKLPSHKGNIMKTIAEQIAALESKRAAHAARMEEIMTKSVEEGRSTEADEQEEFDTLEAEVEQIDADLKRFRALEKAKAAAARPVQGKTAAEGTESRDARAPIRVKGAKLAPGIAVARIARVKALSKMDVRPAAEVAKELYGEESDTYGFFAKAAVAPATTSDTTWAGNLVGDETSAFADFVEYLRPQTILGRFGQNGIPALRSVPFRTPLIGQTTGGEGYWVGEGQAKPLTKFDFSRTTLEPLKVANIAVASKEVLRDSSPSAEAIIRDQLVAALRARLDIDFIDPAKASVTGVSPASITNGVTPIPSTGGDADAIRADIRAVFGAFIAANNAPTSGVWVMPATVALALSLMQNPLGQSEFPGVTMNGGTLFGLPVIVSEYVPTTTSGAYVALVNAGDVYVADEGGFEVDWSREASLQMDDNPDNPTSASTVLVSLWQRNLVGFLAERTINWARRRSEAVQLLSGVNWGVSGS